MEDHVVWKMGLFAFPDLPYKPVGATLPNLNGVEYRTGLARPILTSDVHPSGYWSILSQRWRAWVTSRGKGGRSQFLALPTEILLLIASALPIPSRAPLALTCKRLFDIVGEFKPFAAIELPTEQPLDFRSPRMSKARIYQPARWELLRSLERDLNGKWSLCSECFMLHPKCMFAEYEKSIVPWHKEYYRSHGSDFRSCRQGRKERCVEDRNAWLPSGIVDLCPCIKITIGRKRLLEAWLREKKARSSAGDGPAADFWWHECRHAYGDIDIEARIGLFLYDGAESSNYSPGSAKSAVNLAVTPAPMVGDLGALLEYRHTYPSESQCSSPRLLCPHRNLHITIKALLQCRESHTKQGTVCRLCMHLQHCKECGTKVIDLKTENTVAGMIGCSYRVERCLDRTTWPLHTVFPFARRQIPLQRRSPDSDYPPYR